MKFDAHCYWTSSMPVGWQWNRVSESFQIINGFPFPSDNFNSNGEGLPLVRIRDISSYEFTTFYNGQIGAQVLVANGDIVIGMDGDFNSSWWDRDVALLNQRVAALRPNTNPRLEPRFAFYQIPFGLKIINDLTPSSTVKHLSSSDIAALRLPSPDLPTQKRIAGFLDRETGRIDQLIAKKERMIKVMQEGLLSKLEQLVTPASPSHRQMIPFRWVCRISEGQVDPTSPEWCDKPLIAPNHIVSRTGRLIAIETAQDQGAISGKYAFSSGTVLYSKIRPNLAKACVSSVEGMCSADMYPILPDKRLLPQFLVMQLLSEKFTDWATLESMRVAMPKINRETLGSYRLWVPALDIQEKAGAAFVAAQAQNEALADMVAQSVDRLREYRAALITAAVTGQIDVDTYDRAGKTSATLDRIEEEMQA